MKKQVGDPSTEQKTLHEMKSAMLKDDVTIAGFFGSEEEELYKTYQTACK